MIFRLALDLPEEVGLVRTARLLSRTLLADIAVIKSDIEDVETIVDELCTNVIRHANSQSKNYTVLLEYYKPSVVITVTDKGQGFTESDVRPVGEWRPDMEGGDRIGGFGLPLVQGLTDRLDFSSTDPHGTTVRAEKNLHYTTQAAADKASERDANTAGTATISAE
jgi:anti-sigma regulatory factor (Ser/Thr protein kinase)